VNQLSSELGKWREHNTPADTKSHAVAKNEKPIRRRREAVVGGDVLWAPVDRAAAMLVAKAPWWAHPVTAARFPEIPKSKARESRKTKKTMAKSKPTSGGGADSFVTRDGIKVVMVNGEPMFDYENVSAAICAEVAKLPAETRPSVKSAQDARRIISELVDGLGADVARFREDSKRYLEDIRGTRFAIVSEAGQMTASLREVRQFFLGSDYKEEISRLHEFVGLCERLQKLKESGFLDCVADTMLRLSA
jgi:hypothetical protein